MNGEPGFPGDASHIVELYRPDTGKANHKVNPDDHNTIARRSNIDHESENTPANATQQVAPMISTKVATDPYSPGYHRQSRSSYKLQKVGARLQNTREYTS